MRTSQYWTHTRHGLPQVTSRLQLGHRVWFGFSRHPCTVSALSPSYDIETRCSSMRQKGDDHAIILVLVLDPEHLWIMLCGHDKVLHHLFGPNGPCIMSGLKPKLWVTPHGLPQPQLAPLGYKFSSCRRINSSFVQFQFSKSKLRLIGCNCDDKSFYIDPGPPFLFFTTVVISPFVIRS